MYFFLSFFMPQFAFYRPTKKTTEVSINAEAKEDTIFLETIKAIQTIKLFRHETHRQNNWLNRYAEVINTDIKLSKFRITERSFQ